MLYKMQHGSGKRMSYTLSPMMATHADSRSFVEACAFLTLLVAVHAAAQEVCDKTKCPGPLRFYDGLGCTPVYEKPGDCCAYRYNCSHLKELSKDKCYVNGHEYSPGEILRPDHRKLCDMQCVCSHADRNLGISGFDCGSKNCPILPNIPNCYYKKSHDKCCAQLQVCLKEGEERPTCEVDGKVYKDGESFQPESDLEKDCICMPGYKGENVEPFCKKPNRKHCDPVFFDHDKIHKNCGPIFKRFEVPQTKCDRWFKCQTDNDIVIRNHDSTISSLKTDEDDMCRFGNLTMQRGDELKKATMHSYFCIKCVCEVPPLVTCRELPPKECDGGKEYSGPPDSDSSYFEK